MTFPKGRPRAMTSVSDTSFGSFRIWMTREGGFSSTLSFLLSLPFAGRTEQSNQDHTSAQHYRETLSIEVVRNIFSAKQRHVISGYKLKTMRESQNAELGGWWAKKNTTISCWCRQALISNSEKQTQHPHLPSTIQKAKLYGM